MTTATDETQQDTESHAIGLAEARRLLSETHKVTVGDDDPILMAVTLHQAFIADFEGLLRRHNDQLALEVDGIMTKATNRVADSANVLRDDLLNTAVKNVIASVAHQAESAGLIKHHMRNQLKAQVILTIASVLAAGFALTALFVVLK
ncbi:hypothetical protein [Ferrovibrio xuzhouensis]|uniref:Transcriptional activator TraM n=1 Tax=Ferrovibrio xuzhouensis TaxID=1576914 RepID=A0ABV7VE91_9PROT